MKKFMLSVISRAEKTRLGFFPWILAFLSISFIRNFFEGALESSHTIGVNESAAVSFSRMFIHFNLEWITLFAGLIIILHIAARTPVKTLFNITLFFFAVIIIVPFIDFFFYYPGGSKVEYLYTTEEYVKCLKFFFVPGINVGVSAGVRIEVFLACLFSCSYIWLKTDSGLRAIAGAATIYFCAVSAMCYPVFILLPFYPFYAADFNGFIRSVYRDSVTFSGVAGRDSALTLFLFIPLFIWVLALDSGKKLKKTVPLLINPFELFLFISLFLSGLLMASSRASFEFTTRIFVYPVDYAFAAAGLLLAVLLYLVYRTAAVTRASKNALPYPWHAVLFITVISALMCAFSMTFSVFLTSFLFLAVTCLVYNGLYGLYKNLYIKAVVSAVAFFLVMFTGFAAIYGPGSVESFPLHITVMSVVLLSAAFMALEKENQTQTFKSVAGNIMFICVLIPALWGFRLKALFISAAFGAVIILPFIAGFSPRVKNAVIYTGLGLFFLSSALI